jgi:repressor LexA
MFIGEIIKEYRENHHLSQRAFASRTSLSASYINTLEKIYNPKTQKPYSVTTDAAVEIAKAMNISTEELLNLLDDNQEFITNTSKSNTVIIYGTIPAGIPLECIEDKIDTEEISEDMLKGGKQYFGLKVKGSSMFPDYLDGDIIILEKVDDCESGQDCIVMVNGNDGTFKRVFKNENGIILQPLNPTFSPMVYSNEEIEKLPVKIIGRVVELRRKK